MAHAPCTTQSFASARADHDTLVGVLYGEHHAWLMAWLRRKLGCPHNAADLAHDTFVRLLGSRDGERRRENLREPRAYLATIARGLVIDHWRRQELERAYLDALARLPEAEAPSAEEQALLLELLVRIDTVLDGLRAPVRTAFVLARIEDLPHAEIARRMGVSQRSVERYVAEALLHCYRLRFVAGETDVDGAAGVAESWREGCGLQA
ncbi:MAG: sigma-70 family RNA polymerase sigma factor [Rhodocyclales bacterium]|nr:sigma-70 family RNA polymerase sigma factor [Rhodocyclales bacterium]